MFMRVFFRKLTIPILFIVSTSIPSLAEGNWLKTSSNTKFTSYVKRGEWSSNGRFRIYQHKLVPKDGGEPISLKQLADCEDWRYRPEYETEDKKWRYVSPGSNGDLWLTKVCQK